MVRIVSSSTNHWARQHAANIHEGSNNDKTNSPAERVTYEVANDDSRTPLHDGTDGGNCETVDLLRIVVER